MNKESGSYKELCTEFYDLDKPSAPEDALQIYLDYAKDANGPILEPMCGTGRFLIPLLQQGYDVTGFDNSSHMLNACHEKCKQLGLVSTLEYATFETFSSKNKYSLIFIPSGSFGHLISPEQVSQALTFIASNLKLDGKFVFEVETLKTIREPQGVWRGRWVDRPNGSKIILNVFSQFNDSTRVETGFFRYELWERNEISKTEVEVYHVRHYEPTEIEQLLRQHGLNVIGKWQAEPHVKIEANESTEVILYECFTERN